MSMNQRERDALDRHITGNYGEDQFRGSGITNVYVRNIAPNAYGVETNDSEGVRQMDGDQLLDWLDTLEDDAPTLTLPGGRVGRYGGPVHEAFVEEVEQDLKGRRDTSRP